jgi:hypothetical protein
MQTTRTVGLDIAKSVFQVHGVDADGNVVLSSLGRAWPMTANVGKTTAFHEREPVAIWCGARVRLWPLSSILALAGG